MGVEIYVYKPQRSFKGGDGSSALNIVELTDECRTDKVGVLAYEDPSWGGLVPVYHSHGACITWGHGPERGVWFCFSQGPIKIYDNHD